MHIPMSPPVPALGRLRSALTALRSEMQMRRRLRDLTNLSPAMLQDMGLTRADIAAALRTPIGCSATRALTDRLMRSQRR